jgi:hypothetical protein
MSFSPIPSYEFLGSTILGSSAQTTALVAFPARDVLLVQVTVTSYSGSDIASLRFNGDTTAAATYSSRYLSSAAAATVFTNQTNQSTNCARLFSQGTTMGRSALVAVSNSATAVFKYGAVSSSWTAAGATAATSPPIDIGNWFYTGSQITSMVMVTAGGTITMGAGTGFAVFGRNL